MSEGRALELFLMDRELGDVELAVEAILGEAAPPLEGEERAAAEVEVRKLLETRRDLVIRLNTAYADLLGSLQQLEVHNTALEKEVREFAALLDEWLLWMPSTTAPGGAALTQVMRGFDWLASAERWQTAGDELLQRLRERWPRALLAFTILAVLLRLRRAARLRLARIAAATRRLSTDRISLTWQALGLVAVLAAPLPLFFLIFARGLRDGDGVRPLSVGLFNAASVALLLAFLSHLCEPRGVGEVHFKWRAPATALMKRNLAWVRWPAIIATFVVYATNAQPNEDVRDSLGRLGFLVGIVALFVFWQRVLRPSGELMRPILELHPQGWLARLRWVWYLAALGTILTVGALAVFGYYYTALELDDSLAGTMGLLLVVLLARAVAIRWLLIEQRRIAVAQFQQHREAQAAAHANSSEEVEVAVEDESEVDLSAVNEQTRKLIGTSSAVAFLLGIWWIWHDVLPGLAVLDRINLWTYAATGPDGEAITAWATLQDVLMAAFVLILTITSTRNVPGLLQVTVLKALPIEASTRYAIVTVARYVMTIIGGVAMFQVLGFNWSSLQWLIAALGVGIGFGLQEIIANFVCGLILLFEKPVRIGDTVTIGEASGTVSRIRIRATTLIDWDRKEMVIPNKELITGRVLNWTLSNKLNRVIVNVGAAYGSDTRKVRELLVEVARSHPKVLDDPEPIATFEAFGASTLDFMLRAYLEDYEGRLNTISELHTMVDEAFKQAGIEIALPQLDVHLRSATAALHVAQDPPDAEPHVG